jgi:glutamate dehydrogenase/leucine dehydrogenase
MTAVSEPLDDTGLVITDSPTAGHERLVRARDERTGLRTVIAVHSTALGPALGGTRFFPYRSDAQALADVLRLSEGMSLKSAAAGLDLGGGKAVIIGDPARVKSADLLRAYGRVVEQLAGAYITAEDVGTTVEDMRVVRESTSWVSGLPRDMGGSGDPSLLTARGVHAAMQATAASLWDQEGLSGRRVVIQGVGKVGSELARLLVAAGARVTVSDISDAAVAAVVDRLGVAEVDPSEELSVDCDVFAPCALGAGLDRKTIPQLRCAAVVGAANNQLATEEDAERLDQRGIVYVPDFVANAGGIINISVELRREGYDPAEAAVRVERIYDTTLEVLEAASRVGATPWSAATRLARERIAGA